MLSKFDFENNIYDTEDNSHVEFLGNDDEEGAEFKVINMSFFFFFFFFIGIHSMQGWTATTRRGIIRKRNTKELRHKWNLYRKNAQLKDVC